MMAVRQRGESWQADLTVKGSRYRATFSTRNEAEAWEQKVRVAARQGQEIPDPKPTPATPEKAPEVKPGKAGKGTLSDTAWQCFDMHWRGGRSASKIEYTIKELEGFFGLTCPVSEITTEKIDGYIRYEMDRGSANGTINRKLACLSKILKFAEAYGIIHRLPRFHRRKEVGSRIRFLTQDEEKTLLELFRQWGKEEVADVVAVLIDTGMRNGELWALEARDVDIREGTISIWKNKTDHPRTIYMTKRVRAIVRERLSKPGNASPTAKPFPYNNFWLRNTWDRARSIMGMAKDPNFIPYICRHTCASRLVQRGVSIPVVKDWLGHKTITMTMRYAHLAPTQLMDAARALEGDD